MSTLSEEFFIQKFTHSSSILNPGENPPMERDLQNLRFMLEDRLSQEGLLPVAETALKNAEYAWERHNGAQVNKQQRATGNFLEAINVAAGRLSVISEEILYLDKEIERLESEQEEVKKEEIISPNRLYRLQGHVDQSGNYTDLDGRSCKVVEEKDTNGKIISSKLRFEDDNSEVSDYIAKAKAFQARKRDALHQEQAARAEQRAA